MFIHKYRGCVQTFSVQDRRIIFLQVVESVVNKTMAVFLEEVIEEPNVTVDNGNNNATKVNATI